MTKNEKQEKVLLLFQVSPFSLSLQRRCENYFDCIFLFNFDGWEITSVFWGYIITSTVVAHFEFKLIVKYNANRIYRSSIPNKIEVIIYPLIQTCEKQFLCQFCVFTFTMFVCFPSHLQKSI